MGMEKIERRCFRIFMVWQEEKETAWLRRMANQGWHLQRIMVFMYIFAKKAPQDIVFFRDFTVLGAKDIDEYIGVFQDTGWRFVCRQSNWFYFASSAENRYGEVYTDNQGRLRSYQSLLLLHVFEIVMLNFVLLLTAKRIETDTFSAVHVLMVLLIFLLIGVIYSTIRLIALVSRLKKSLKE
jgi:hypothetical protein